MSDPIQHIDFDNHVSEDFFKQLIHFTNQYFKDLPKKKGFISDASQINNTELLSPETTASFNEILDFVLNQLNHTGIQAASGNHLGYIPGGGLFENGIGNFLSAITNSYSGVAYASPLAVEMENKLLQWTSHVIGYGTSAKGNITSGGSVANLTAIATAKKALKVSYKDIAKRCIYLSKHTHHSVLKALNLTGLHEATIRLIPLTENLQMDVKHLEDVIKKDVKNGWLPSIIISSAGTTNSGAIDNISRINQIAQAYKAWHHVDAAYGGFFMLCKSQIVKFKGIEVSDSVTLDPHKGLFQSYGSGIVLVRNGALLADTFNTSADYMRETETENIGDSPADLSIELSRPFRALPLWLSLKLHSIDKFSKALEEKLKLTDLCYKQLKSLGFKVGPKPQLTVILFRTTTNSLTQRLIQDIHASCDVFLSTTQIDKLIWIRVAILSHRTSLKQINSLIDFLETWKTNNINA